MKSYMQLARATHCTKNPTEFSPTISTLHNTQASVAFTAMHLQIRLTATHIQIILPYTHRLDCHTHTN